VSTTGIVELLTVFVLAAFVGNEVISKVPSVLHTPLMSGSNAIHGIILVGTIIVLGDAHGATEETLGFLAVLLATLNVVGGFVVTDRMLQMFKGRSESRRPDSPDGATGTSSGSASGVPGATRGPGATGGPGGAAQ
jgi:H+-translocating NAD(P) transhydrogenase subunit alpha